MIKKYLVKLTPHDKFFFGGETTFGEDRETNYFVKSNCYPQQTTLLGLVRYMLMIQNGKGVFENNKIIKPDEAAKLISHKSFDINDEEFSFGKIKELSPVFIASENNEFLFPANREYQWDDKEKKYVLREFNKIKNSECKICGTKDFIPYLEKYKAKDEMPELLISTDKKLLKYPDIFIEHKQTGIRKNYKGKTDEKAFYIQFFYKMKKGYSFVFILAMEEDIKFETTEIVTIGGEQSKFRMEVSLTEKGFDDILPQYEYSNESQKIVLTSDAFVSNDIFNDCDFAITDTIDFRSIKSTVNTTKYSSMDRTGKKSDQLSKSGKYNFFKKGSVFYGEDISGIIKHFNEKNAARKIGYNHYKIVDKKENKL